MGLGARTYYIYYLRSPLSTYANITQHVIHLPSISPCLDSTHTLTGDFLILWTQTRRRYIALLHYGSQPNIYARDYLLVPSESCICDIDAYKRVWLHKSHYIILSMTSLFLWLSNICSLKFRVSIHSLKPHWGVMGLMLNISSAIFVPPFLLCNVQKSGFGHP